jgi:glycosyltransferase involved in cell wall biosynthesis
VHTRMTIQWHEETSPQASPWPTLGVIVLRTNVYSRRLSTQASELATVVMRDACKCQILSPRRKIEFLVHSNTFSDGAVQARCYAETETNMKILTVNSSLLDPLGGAEQYTIESARAFVAAGHDVIVATPWLDEAVKTRLMAEGLRVVRLRSHRPYAPNQRGPRLLKVLFHGLDFFGGSCRRQIERLVLSECIDVVHLHRWQGLGLGVFRLRNAALVHTVHDFALVDTRTTSARAGVAIARLSILQRSRTRIVSARIRQRATLIFPSQRTLDRHIQLGLDDRDNRCVVIPHGWVLSRPITRSRPRSDEPVRFLFLGKYCEEKGFQLLLDAWGDGLPNARLTVGGTGPLRGQVEALSELGIIAHLGWLDREGVSLALSNADVVLFPSLGPENFPLVVAESLLAGIPIVTTIVASSPILRHEYNALCVNSEAGDLRAALVELAGNRAHLSLLANGAAESAVQLDMVRHAERITQLFKEEANMNDHL